MCGTRPNKRVIMVQSQQNDEWNKVKQKDLHGRRPNKRISMVQGQTNWSLVQSQQNDECNNRISMVQSESKWQVLYKAKQNGKYDIRPNKMKYGTKPTKWWVEQGQTKGEMGTRQNKKTSVVKGHTKW